MGIFETKYEKYKCDNGEYDLSSLSQDEILEAIDICKNEKNENIVINFTQDNSEIQEPSVIELMNQLFGDFTDINDGEKGAE